MNKPILILLLLFLSGCGREENTAGNKAENEIENKIESNEDASAETESDDEAAIAIENESTDSTSAETEAADSLYPLLAVPSSAERIDFVFVAEGSYCIFDGEKYGYITEDGDEITPCIYDIAYPFSEGLACVCKDGKYGYIDSQGEVAIPFEFDRATPFVEGLAYFAAGESYGFMDKTGAQVFSFECDSVSSFQEGLAYFSIDGRYGYIDQNGQTVIEPVFDDAGYFQDGLAKVMKNGRFGVVNREGEIIVDAEYDSVTIGDSFIEAHSDEKYACFDRSGKAFLEQYDRIIWTSGGNYVYVKKGEEYGLADKKGNVLFEPLYDMISLLPGENFLLIRENELYGIADLQGEIRIPAVYRDICYDSYERKEDDAEGGMLVLTDADGDIESMDINDFSETIPCDYGYINWISQDRAVIRNQDGHNGLIDRGGNLIEPIDYYMYEILADGAVCLKNKAGVRFYNNRGEVVESMSEYDNISKAGNYCQVEKDGKYGFLNEKGEEVIPPVYRYVTHDGVYGCFDSIYILTESDFRGSIIKTREAERADISGLLLQNEITPRIRSYQEFTKSGSISVADSTMDGHTVTQENLRAYKKTYKLYDLNHAGAPILYFKAEPYKKNLFPESYSGFYTIRNNQIVEVVTGYECGGSLRGDYACFWYDSETSRILPGTNGVWGGFGGSASSGTVCDVRDGEITSIVSFGCIVQPVSYFGDEELAHPELVYDEDDKPYTKEMIEQAESGKLAWIYYVNDGQTTIEKYQGIEDRYRMLSYAE